MRILAALAAWRIILASAVIALGLAGGTSYYQSTPYVIASNSGGIVLDFIEQYEQVRRSGRSVRLDGICMSACTLVAGLIPQERVCTTPFGKLAFHSAWQQTVWGASHSSEGTRLLWQIYPENVRAILRSRGWDGAAAPTDNEHPDLIYVDGKDLLTIFHRCQ